ncbi:MAG TPA: gamma carbonic anhydrase family protein [Leptospiraceae bacterium]|nr:gamma carbonic anhydrase family protein [Leptospiraceae bacterium]HMY67889.1 gamma carbonic anhydrase family protein [Leptospiraceae bacterium]HMZ59811.1 gamma carbonic anhydrase family protein [Leptospiraceae bacterium]HNF12918.1 gamma carbonic anhydrase family protein [Leptospiraceae bacterium]HNF24960.1 gamma carbonic anhydrase family protein [Leptospiraceae bacterium]
MKSKKTAVKNTKSVKKHDPFIHKSATVIGMVKMGKDCSIWPGAVLRGDTKEIILGNAVNIQDNCTLHTDSQNPIRIGDYTLVGHNAILHGCTVGKGCLIGIGSIILDKAEIGDGAMITAGCMIRGGMKIPSRAMVVQKDGKLQIYENKAKVQLTIAGCLEYIALAERHRKKIFKPFTPAEEKHFIDRAEEIMKDLGLDSFAVPAIE